MLDREQQSLALGQSLAADAQLTPDLSQFDCGLTSALVKPDEVRLAFSPRERLLILDTWQRSGLPAGDFAPLVGLSKHTLYLWKKRFAEQGPAGLAERPRGAKTPGKLSEVTRRTIVMLKQAHPDLGCQRISD